MQLWLSKVQCHIQNRQISRTFSLCSSLKFNNLILLQNLLYLRTWVWRQYKSCTTQFLDQPLVFVHPWRIKQDNWKGENWGEGERTKICIKQQKTDQSLQNNTYAATSSGSLWEQCGFVIIMGLPTCESNALMMLSSAFRMLKKRRQSWS